MIILILSLKYKFYIPLHNKYVLVTNLAISSSPQWTQNRILECYPWFSFLPICFLKVSFLIESIYTICLSADGFYNLYICSYNLCHKVYSHISSFLLNNHTGYLTNILNKIFPGTNIWAPSVFHRHRGTLSSYHQVICTLSIHPIFKLTLSDFFSFSSKYNQQFHQF